MLNKAQYEKRISDEIQTIPEEALPKIIQMLSLLREEFMEQETVSETSEDDITHIKTRQLLSSSKSNWANDIINDREDRMTTFFCDIRNYKAVSYRGRHRLHGKYLQ